MSLVPYVPSTAPATGNESLSQSLAIGNITGANDIAVSNPQKLDFDGNIVLKNHTGSGGTDVIINNIPANVGPPFTRQLYFEVGTNKVKHQLQFSETLAQTLQFGMETGANDLIVDSPQKINFTGWTTIYGGFQTGISPDFIINSIPLNPGPLLPNELCIDLNTNNVYYQSSTPNTFPTYDANLAPYYSPCPAANIQYANNANLGMKSGTNGYGVSYALTSYSRFVYPPQPIYQPPQLLTTTVPQKPYITTAKSGSSLFAGAPVKDRLWYKLNTTAVFSGVVNEVFGITFDLKNTTTGQTLTNQNYYSTGDSLTLPRPANAFPLVIDGDTYYNFEVEDCFNVGVNGFCSMGDALQVLIYGWFQESVGNQTPVGSVGICEAYSQGFSPT